MKINQTEEQPEIRATNKSILQKEHQIPPTDSSMIDIDDEVRQCPMCYWEFPVHLTLDGKKEHIEHHFE